MAAIYNPAAMLSNDQRLQSLNAAATLGVMRRSLGSAGYSSIVWGMIWLAIAGLRYSNVGVDVTVMIFGLFSVALIIEGIYVLRSRSRRALTCEAVTLGVLAIWNLSAFAYTAYMASSSHHTGRWPNPLFGIIMGFNAWQTWRSRSVYSELEKNCTESDLQTVDALISGAVKADAETTPELIALKQTGIAVTDPQWRLWLTPDYLYLINVHTLFSRKRPVSAAVVPRASVSVQVIGEKWIGSGQKIKLVIDGEASEQTFEISRPMLEKFSLATGLMLTPNAI